MGQEFLSVESIGDVQDIDFRLEKNGEIVQSGNTGDMLFSIDRIIAEVSKYFTLKMGDLIMTGTPEGVGPISIGDELAGYIGEREMFRFKVN